MVNKNNFRMEPNQESKQPEEIEEWGWPVILATFFIRVTIPSLRVCFGIIYLELMQRESLTNLDVSWIVAVFIASFNISSPISTLLSLYCSHRLLVFIGILLISLGLALCSLSLRLPFLVLSYGVLGGIGSSLASTNSFLVIQKYLTRKRKKANFLASLGTSLSLLVMPLAVYGLIFLFSLRGAFLIWSSIILNGLVGAMFYTSILWQSKFRHHKTEKLDNLLLWKPSEYAKEFPNKESPQKEVEDINSKNRSAVKETDPICVTVQNDDNNSIINSTELDTNAQDNFEKSKNLNTEKSIISRFRDSNDGENEIMKSLPELSEYEDCTNDTFLDVKYNKKRPESFMSTATSVESFKTMKSIYKSAEDVFISVECMDILGNNILLEQKDDDISEPEVTETTEIDIESENSCREPSASTNTPIRHLEAIETASLGKINISKPFHILSLKPLRKCIFLVYMLSTVINKQIYLSYIIYLPLIAMKIGCLEQIPTLLVIIATSEFIGKFSFSLYSKNNSRPEWFIYIAVSILNASSCVVLLLGNGFLTMVIASVGLGLGMGICISLDPLFLMKNFSTDLLSRSYGLILLITGAFSLILFPLQGWALDKTESFKILGIVMTASALIPVLSWSFAPIFISRKKKRKLHAKYKI